MKRELIKLIGGVPTIVSTDPQKNGEGTISKMGMVSV